MKIRPEKPKEPRVSPCSSVEAANLKKFLETTNGVLPLLEAILADAYEQLNHYRLADYSRDVATLRRRYANEGLSFATKTLPSLFGDLLLTLETGKPSYPSFKMVRGGKHPVFLRQLFAMVFGSDDDQTTATAMKCLYQFCCAFKKLKGPYSNSTLRKQLWSFVETDIELKYIDYTAGDLWDLCDHAGKYITTLCGSMSPEWDVCDFVPRPGPGATNQPRRKNVRYRPHVLYEQLDEVFHYEDWFFSHPWDLVTEPMRLKALERRETPSSRFKFVDKTYAKPRGICIEELETQYLQQGIKNALYRRIESHPMTKGRVNFSDQSVNGGLALESSRSKDYATIDMSEASDRISRRLVKILFHRCPDLCEALLATSTRVIELPDDIDFIAELPSEKFAPMGSATCFPIMSLVHYALIRAILVKCGHSHDVSRDIFVYGDDIIVRSECVNDVYDWLPQFGMKLNTEKSYHRSHFRESCGVHAYDGVEITPVYLKYTPHSQSHEQAILSLRAAEHGLFERGFKRTAALLRSEIHKVKRFKVRDVPYVSPKSPIFGWIREDDDAPLVRYSGLKRRWVEETQSFLYLARVINPKSDDLNIDQESECYLRWMLENANPDRQSHGDRLTPHRHTDHLRDFALLTKANEPPLHHAGEPWLRPQTVMESQEVFTTKWEWCPDSAF